MVSLCTSILCGAGPAGILLVRTCAASYARFCDALLEWVVNVVAAVVVGTIGVALMVGVFQWGPSSGAC